MNQDHYACGVKAGLGAMRADPSLVLYHTLSYAVRFGDSGEESAESGMAAFPKLMSYCSKLSWVRTAGTTGAAWCGVMWCAEGMARQQQLAPRCPAAVLGSAALPGLFPLQIKGLGYSGVSMGIPEAVMHGV